MVDIWFYGYFHWLMFYREERPWLLHLLIPRRPGIGMLSFTQADPLEKKHCVWAKKMNLKCYKVFWTSEALLQTRETSGSSSDLKLLCPEQKLPNWIRSKLSKNTDNVTEPKHYLYWPLRETNIETPSFSGSVVLRYWIRLIFIDVLGSATPVNYAIKGRWVANLGSAPACYGSSMGSNPDISQKYKMDDTGKGVANTL